MSKHALLVAVKTLAIEMSHKKIKVNMVSPGFVDTPLTRKNLSKEKINYLNANIPLGLTTPESIANVCKFLITQNEAITGQNLIIDGGYSLIGI
jgi:3-oxoacyl-[acyl-carrier protein] reductase